MDYQALAQELLTVLSRHPKSELAGDFNSVNKGEHLVLGRLAWEGDGITAGNLSRKLGLTTGRIATILGSLEKKGLIKRINSPADGRVVLVYLTEEGSARAQAYKAKTIEKIEKMFIILGEDDASNFVRIIKRIMLECRHGCQQDIDEACAGDNLEEPCSNYSNF